MKVNLHLTLAKINKTNPAVIDQVGIKEIVLEDVADLHFSDNSIDVRFNTGTTEVIPLRSNDGEGIVDWRAISMNIIRKFITFDPNN